MLSRDDSRPWGFRQFEACNIYQGRKNFPQDTPLGPFWIFVSGRFPMTLPTPRCWLNKVRNVPSSRCAKQVGWRGRFAENRRPVETTREVSGPRDDRYHRRRRSEPSGTMAAEDRSG